MSNKFKKFLKIFLIFLINVFILALLFVPLNIYFVKTPIDKNFICSLSNKFGMQQNEMYSNFRFSSPNIEDYTIESVGELTQIENTSERWNKFCGEDRTEFKYIDSIGGGVKPLLLL